MHGQITTRSSQLLSRYWSPSLKRCLSGSCDNEEREGRLTADGCLHETWITLRMRRKVTRGAISIFSRSRVRKWAAFSPFKSKIATFPFSWKKFVTLRGERIALGTFCSFLGVNDLSRGDRKRLACFSIHPRYFSLFIHTFRRRDRTTICHARVNSKAPTLTCTLIILITPNRSRYGSGFNCT